jgi:group I intron endonuclease
MFTIYRVLNTVNQKSYIGFTTQNPPENRWKRHQVMARHGRPGHLDNAIRKDGVHNFSFVILEQGDDAVYGLKVLEPKYIAGLKEEFRYNETLGGEGLLGYRRSKEQNHRISERMRGKSYAKGSRTEEFKQKCSSRMKNHTFAEVTKKKLSAALIDIPKPTSICPHCQKIGGNPTMKRWHFDNCKRKT